MSLRSTSPFWRFSFYGLVAMGAVLGMFQGMRWVQSQRAGYEPVTRLNQGDPFAVLYFHRHGCPHCAIANPVMAELQLRYPSVSWLVVEVRPDMDPHDHSLYQFWLEQSGKGKDQVVTPLIVVGAGTREIYAQPGFGDPIISRQPIENEIRKRLALPAIDLPREAVRFPLIGMRVIPDLSPADANRLLGWLSGGKIFSFLVFCSMLWAPLRRTPRFAFLFSTCCLLGWAALQWAAFQGLFHPLNPLVGTGVRLLLGFWMLHWGWQLLRSFFLRPGEELSTSAQPYQPTARIDGLFLFVWFLGFSWLEFAVSAWIPEFAGRLLGAEWQLRSWLLYSLAPFAMVAVLANLYLIFGEFSPRAKRVGSLFSALLFFLLGCYLLFSMRFTGHGPFWASLLDS